MYKNINRRDFITKAAQVSGYGAVASMLPFNLVMAKANGNQRLFTVFLRGAMDGLAAVIPYGDPQYQSLRGSLALTVNEHGILPIDKYFAFHPNLSFMSELYAQKQLAVLHATSSPYRRRSHFDAQNCLENGTNTPNGINTGWLNRALYEMHLKQDSIAFSPSLPLLFRGNSMVDTWYPSVLPSINDDFFTRLQRMYASDQQLLPKLEQARASQSNMQIKNTQQNSNFSEIMRIAGLRLGQDNGMRVGGIDLDGWDTHSQQGVDKGRLANNFKQLDNGIRTFKKALGNAWSDTVVLVFTEFGRTVRVNGTAGTDHGTGGVAFVLGGGVQGGKFLGDWPGLANLYEDRDLFPTNDLRSLFKTVLNQHMKIEMSSLNTKVFPGSVSVKTFIGLVS